MENKTIGIYGIFRKSDDKCMYIGQSIDCERRINEHLKGYSHIDVNENEYYGKPIEIHETDDKRYRLQREVYWINELNPELNQIRDGSNWNKGTHGRINIWNKGLTKYLDERVRKMSEQKIGFSPSKETREKISKTRKQTSIENPRIWVNDGKNDFYIFPSELEYYLNKGYIRGRVFKKRKRKTKTVYEQIY